MVFLVILLLLYLIVTIPGNHADGFDEFCQLECGEQRGTCAGRCR